MPAKLRHMARRTAGLALRRGIRSSSTQSQPSSPLVCRSLVGPNARADVGARRDLLPVPGEVPLDRVVGQPTVAATKLEEHDTHAVLEFTLSDDLMGPTQRVVPVPVARGPPQDFQWIILISPVGSPPLKMVGGFSCP
jgi:hypothetical protein